MTLFFNTPRRLYIHSTSTEGRSYVKSTEQTHATQVTAESHEFSCLHKSAREETCMTQVKSAWGAQHRIPIFTVFAIRSTGHIQFSVPVIRLMG